MTPALSGHHSGLLLQSSVHCLCPHQLHGINALHGFPILVHYHQFNEAPSLMLPVMLHSSAQPKVISGCVMLRLEER